jgi:hypothetical protein
MIQLWIKLANSSILISGCDSVFIKMYEPKKRKAFSIQEKTDILAQVDANKEMYCTGYQIKNYCQHWTLFLKTGKVLWSK